jgi:hypothetical protein
VVQAVSGIQCRRGFYEHEQSFLGTVSFELKYIRMSLTVNIYWQRVLISEMKNKYYREILGQETYPSDWNVTGVNICHVYALALPYFLLVLVLEYANDGGSGGLLGRALRAFQSFWIRVSLRWYGIRTDKCGENGTHYSRLGDEENKLEADEDIEQERQYVMKNKEELRQTAPVVLLNLWKIYPPSVGMLGSLLSGFRSALSAILFYWGDRISDTADDAEEETSFSPKEAVCGVTTAINKGETYALLGTNGTCDNEGY